MPEIKHTFTGGKMNKDLDIRYVPQGEYRDALNVQVRTTDGGGDGDGDSGTVQNIKGNSSTGETLTDIGLHSLVNPPSNIEAQTTVAMISDEKSDKVYSFVAAPPIETSHPGNTVSYIDAIIEHDLVEDVTAPVLIDHFCTILDNHSNDVAPNNNTTFFSINLQSVARVRVGMEVSAFDADDNSLLQDAFIDEINEEENYIVLNKQQNTDISVATKFIFKSERVLKFNINEPFDFTPGTTPVAANKITGVNIIDDLLFWTDNINEPKKININRCKAGCVDFVTHTKLFIKDPLDETQFIEAIGTVLDPEPAVGLALTNDIREEHVTVMRQAPNMPPTLEMRRTKRPGKTSISDFNWDFSSFSNLLAPSVELAIQFGDNILQDVDWRLGDRITFIHSTDSSTEIRIVTYLQEIGSNDGIDIYTFKPSAVFNQEDIQGPLSWNISLEESKALFETKLCRFGYRYKYEDGEYSSFSPFSEVAFLPGEFDYEPKKGFNLGMVNTIKYLAIKDFIPHISTRQPDVCAVDILYKTTDSPVVHVVETITRSKSNEWELFTYGSQNNNVWEFGKLEITSEMIHKALPSNQILRAWDYVPRVALAQDIVGNRLVYGNFVQGYNIDSLVSLKQVLVSNNNASPTTPLKSLKSIRKYKFGMVFGDKYGRETPVISSTQLEGSGENLVTSTGDISVSKDLAPSQNLIRVQQEWDGLLPGQPEDWMEYVKYYAKETSNEYYNLVLDRWYFAEDGNVWLSFQSADRNKVDEQTYLILKNENGSNEPVPERARYKIIAISNEAPEFIKIENRIMGSIRLTSDDFVFMFEDGDATTNPNAVAPVLLQDTTTITIQQNTYDDFLSEYVAKPNSNLKVRIVGQSFNSAGDLVNSITSNSFKTVTHFTKSTTSSTAKIFIDSSFGEEANMLAKFDALGYPLGGANDLSYFLEFKEEVPKNKPEFDGKFFVKVEVDTVLRQRVLGFNNINIGYDPIRTLPIGYIDTQLVNPGQSNFQNEALIKAPSHPGVNDYSQYIFMNARTSGSSVNGQPLFKASFNSPNNFLHVVGFNSGNNISPPFAESFGCHDGNSTVASAEINRGDFPGVLGETYNDSDIPRVSRFALGCFRKNNFTSNNPVAGQLQDSLFNWEAYVGDDIDAWQESDLYENTTFGFNSLDQGLAAEQWINFQQETFNYWGWFRLSTSFGENYADNPRYKLYNNDTSALIFLDGARAFFLKWEQKAYGGDAGESNFQNGPGQIAEGYVDGKPLNNDGVVEGPATSVVDQLQPCRFYKPTAFSKGLVTDIANVPATFGPTPQGEFGRVTISASGPHNLSFGLAGSVGEVFYTHMTTEGNYFSFSDDVSDAGQPCVYQIVGNISNGGLQTDTNVLNCLHKKENNLSNKALPFVDTEEINLTGDAPLLLGKYDGSSSCGSTDPVDDARTSRSTFRVEFRKVNRNTGELLDFGTRGLNFEADGWDPRSKLTHDGRTVLKFNLLKRVDTSGEFNKAVSLNACFETEPKEDVGLDLYYEASPAIPMRLDSTNTLDFAPYYSGVTVKRGDVNNLSNVTLANTEHKVAHVDYSSTNPIILVTATDSLGNTIPHISNIVLGDYLVFNHSDGMQTMAKITNFMRPVINTPDTEDQIIPATSEFFNSTTSQYVPIESENFNMSISYAGYTQNVNGQVKKLMIINAIDPVQGNLPIIAGTALQITATTSPVQATIPENLSIETIVNQGILGDPASPLTVTLNEDDWVYDQPIGQYNQNVAFDPNATYIEIKAVAFKTESLGFYEIDPNVWQNPVLLAWHNCYSFGNGVESDRIRDDFNAPQIDNGVIVSTVSEEYGEQKLGSRLIHSGIYNSTSGVNDLNEFNIGESITKDLNPSYGSIQALKTRNTDIIAFCEDKILKVLANKDALFNADGNRELLATNRVLGTAVPFNGDYGISKNAESLAVDQYRMYFTDQQRGAVLRLSGDGITPISNVGMKSYFRENIKSRSIDHLIGSFDSVMGEYNLTVKHNHFHSDESVTISFNEGAKGWVSFKSFIQEAGTSCTGTYLTGFQEQAYAHNSNDVGRNNFYGIQYDTTIDVVFNDQPSSIKSFYTINYEGSQARTLLDIINTNTVSFPAVPSNETSILDVNNFIIENVDDGEFYNLNARAGWFVESFETDLQSGRVLEFKEKERKWFNKICGVPTNQNNIDTSEFSFQGIGIANNINVVLQDISGGSGNLNIEIE